MVAVVLNKKNIALFSAIALTSLLIYSFVGPQNYSECVIEKAKNLALNTPPRRSISGKVSRNNLISLYLLKQIKTACRVKFCENKIFPNDKTCH